MKAFLYWLFCVDHDCRWIFGKVEGYSIPCRKCKITGKIEAKYRDKNEHKFSFDSWAEIAMTTKHRFIADI